MNPNWKGHIKMEPLVSIIIPFFNTNKKLFERCIKSVINQKYCNIECIVVDDGSSEEYSSFLNEYFELDKRIRVYHKTNGGLGNTRNYGVSEARGDYVFFVDSDDFISPYAIQNGVDIAQRNNADVVIGCSVHAFPDELCEYKEKESNTIILTHRKEFTELTAHISGYKNPRFLCANGIFGPSAWSKLVRRQIAEQVPFVNDKYWGEEILWCLSLFNICEKVVIADIKWYNYVFNPQSMIRKYAGDRSIEFMTRAKQEFALAKKNWPEYMQIAYYCVFYSLFTYVRTDICNPNNTKSKKERYQDFCKAISFDEFNEMVKNISFDYELRFIHKTIKKLLMFLLKRKSKKAAFELLAVCNKRIKF